MIWLYVILAGLSGAILSLILGLLLVSNNKEYKIISYSIAFAAGALISAAFFDLLHEAIELAEEVSLFGSDTIFFIMGIVIIGILIFFILETILSNFHSHAHNQEREEGSHSNIGIMVTISDSLHNFIDGIAIGAAFLINPISGLIITIVILVHEIPQEIGDIALMRANGISKKDTILLNIISGLASLIGALLFFGIGQIFTNIQTSYLAPIFALVSGFFIYLATTDIIPTLHQEHDKKKAISKMLILILGVVVLALLIYFLHNIG